MGESFTFRIIQMQLYLWKKTKLYCSKSHESHVFHYLGGVTIVLEVRELEKTEESQKFLTASLKVKISRFLGLNMMLAVSTKMLFQEVRKISLGSGKTQGEQKWQRSGHLLRTVFPNLSQQPHLPPTGCYFSKVSAPQFQSL